jgi:phospholipid/cholesterol/gamma-HCH transport system substrate-binding protein
VRFNVDADQEVPEDSSVGIRWRNVVGQRFLYLYPGSADESLGNGDRIPVEQTQSVADMAEFLNRAGPILKAIDPRQANAFLDAMNTALSGNEQNIRALIDSGASLAQELGAKDEQIADLIDSSDEVMNVFASQSDDLGSFIDDLDSVSAVLERRTNEINSLVTNFADVQEELYAILSENRTNIDATIDGLDSVASTLNENRRNLARSLDTMPLGVAGYFQTSSWGEFFNVRIIKLLVRDQEGNIIAEASEQDNQHGDEGGGPADPNGGGGKGEGEGGDGSQQVSEGIEALLRFTLSGGGS